MSYTLKASQLACLFSSVQSINHVCLNLLDMALHCIPHPSTQIPEAQELSPRTPYPADTREHFAPEPREPPEGL